MAHPFHHALSSVKKWGGCVDNYLPIHQWFDQSKQFLADFRHRALRHHAEGIFMCETIFGTTITNSDGRKVPVRWIGEQHVQEDLGFIPTVADWFKCIKSQAWMMRRGPLAVTLAKEGRHVEEIEDGPTDQNSGDAEELPRGQGTGLPCPGGLAG